MYMSSKEVDMTHSVHNRHWACNAFALVTLLVASSISLQAQESQTFSFQWAAPAKASNPISSIMAAATLQSQSGSILFDLSTVSSVSTPLTQTVQGLTATFSSPGDPAAFSI